MKFTIFTSFYNYIDTIDDLYDSVISQTYKNWEWIVSDDFSDNLEVTKKLKELSLKNDKIKIIKPNYKKEFYWNPPTKKTNSDIFLVLDSDDMMHPKLLEVYKHNFDKFPDVQLISTNSILRHNNINGGIHSFRYVKYGNDCNLYEKWKNSKPGEYALGDCRAWRNNIDKFEKDNCWGYCCSEDVSKVLVCEEIGKIMYLPRTLHTYAHRENSISNSKIYGTEAYNELVNMYENAEKRKNRKYLNSFHDFYDRIIDETTTFYLSNFNLNGYCNNIEYYSSTINARDIERLKVLYFDQNIVFDYNENTDYLLIKIQNEEDILYLNNRIKNLPKKELVIELDENVKTSVDETLRKNNMTWYWFGFGKLFYIIKF